MNENQITLVSDDGIEELAEILFTHEVEGVNYVVFEVLESGEVSAAIYIEGEDGEGELVDIETDEEWAMLDELVEEYYDALEEEYEDEDSESEE